jgi:tetratricopeptide (TPR) repeat protein
LKRIHLLLALLLAVTVAGFAARPQAQAVPEQEIVARGHFDNGRDHMQRKEYEEGLKDFNTIVQSYPRSALADNALLEISLYYMNVVDDTEKAKETAKKIIADYRDRFDSAPNAYLVLGEAELTRSRAADVLKAARADLDRVESVYANSDAIPRARYLAAEASRLAHEPEDALRRYRKIELDFPSSPIISKVHIGAGTVLASTGQLNAAMEEFQRARTGGDADATTALSRLTVLYRLYVRPPEINIFTYNAKDGMLMGKVSDVISMLAPAQDTLYYATKSSVATIKPPRSTDAPPQAAKPRGLALDRSGRPVVIEEGTLKRKGDASPLTLKVPDGNSAKLLDDVDAAVQLKSGDWLVTSGNDRGIDRFTIDGRHLGTFAKVGHAVRLAVNEFDEVATIDRDQKKIDLFDPTGKVIRSMPLRAEGYEIRNPMDLAFDPMGHLYVLDRSSVFVFSPYRQPSAFLRRVADPENSPGAFRDATAFAVDLMGRMYVSDDRTKQIRIYQ